MQIPKLQVLIEAGVVRDIEVNPNDTATGWTVRILTDLAKLRELEAERAAVRERLDFHQSKADWIQERIHKGYEGDVEKLWETAQKQNAEAAAVQRLDGLIAAQRRQVAHTAGAQWEPLLKYLADQGRLPE
jgi:hypothetical protein